MSAIWNWVVARLKEPSTWAGIAVAATAVGSVVGSDKTVAASLVPAIIAIIKAETGSIS